MKKFYSSLCAATVAFSVVGTGFVPTVASAAPVVPQVSTPGAEVIQVQSRREMRRARRQARREARRDRRQARRAIRQDRRQFRRALRQDRRQFRRAHRRGWYRGYRGYDYYRPGYRYYDGFWFPLAAFAAGAIISGALDDDRVYYGRGYSEAHYDWCYNRYRSYRASDNTFQPYHGPRRQCYSPYS